MDRDDAASVADATVINSGLDVLAGIAEFPAHLLHVGDQSGADWGAGNYLQALGDLGAAAAAFCDRF